MFYGRLNALLLCLNEEEFKGQRRNMTHRDMYSALRHCSYCTYETQIKGGIN